jgi:hypothetical protein
MQLSLVSSLFKDSKKMVGGSLPHSTQDREVHENETSNPSSSEYSYFLSRVSVFLRYISDFYFVFKNYRTKPDSVTLPTYTSVQASDFTFNTLKNKINPNYI